MLRTRKFGAPFVFKGENKMKKIVALVFALLLVCALAFCLAACRGEDVKSIQGTAINDAGELVITYTDGSTENLGKVVGNAGDTPTVEISSDGYWVINGEKTNVKAKGEDSSAVVENPQGLDFYLLDDNTYAVGAGNSKFLSRIEIPATYNGKPVSKIADSGFIGSAVKEMVIPDSVTSIGEDAFLECTSLTIYCEAASKPSGWNINWNYSNRPVVWDYKNK